MSTIPSPHDGIAWLALLIIACLLGACGPAAPAGAASPAVPVSDGIVNWPECTPVITQMVQPPSSFPASFPLPWGIRVYQTATLGAGTANPQLQIVALAPMSVSDASAYLLSQLPRTGYHFKFIEFEGSEADAQINGNGWIGGYKLTSVSGCNDVSEWTVALGRLSR